MKPILLKEPQVCECLGLGRSTVRRLWAEGVLVPVKIGMSLRWSAAEVARYVEELQGQTEQGN